MRLKLIMGLVLLAASPLAAHPEGARVPAAQSKPAHINDSAEVLSDTYRIETKKGEVAERIGVATSVLTKIEGSWKILSMHNSARRPKES